MNNRDKKYFIAQIFPILIFIIFVFIPFLSLFGLLKLEAIYLYIFISVLLLLLSVSVSSLRILRALLNDIREIFRSFQKKKKEKKLLKNITIVAYYEPPSHIHPAIAGYLIDRKVGKREFYAVLLNAIVNGFIVIDEIIDNGGYKYYFLKNKSFKKAISCDRLVSESIFYQNGKNLDQVSFKDIKINPSVIAGFISRESIKLKYFEDPYYIPVESKQKIEWLNALDLKKMEIYSFVGKERKPAKKRKSDYYYSSYTPLGIQERIKWLGFKDYLQTAERFRLDKEKVETFSKYLPYAVALGVHTEWLKRFENMKVDRLEWFQSQIPGEIKRHNKVYFKHLEKFLEII